MLSSCRVLLLLLLPMLVVAVAVTKEVVAVAWPRLTKGLNPRVCREKRITVNAKRMINILVIIGSLQVHL
jgi:hypothetical protein